MYLSAFYFRKISDYTKKKKQKTRVMVEEEIVLVCPRGARAGQTLYYRDKGKRYATTLPGGVRPGDRFCVKKTTEKKPLDVGKKQLGKSSSAVSLSKVGTGSIEKNRMGKSQSVASLPKATSGTSKKAENIPVSQDHSKALLSAYSELGKSKSCSSLKKGLSDEDRELIDEYRQRQRRGELGDEVWWGKRGFKGQKQHDENGNGAPKWSPYYHASPTAPVVKKEVKTTVLGDQAWWEQYGFKGSVSLEKKRDYGNGIPGWSPYHRSREPSADEPPKPKVNLPPDAFWFKQWGFRTGGDTLSEEKRRDYGYGVPMWSPYYHPSSQRGKSAVC